MKHIIEFDPIEDQQEFEDALNGSKWRYVLEEFDDYLRKASKHEDKEFLNIEELREKLNTLKQEEGL